MFHLGTVSSIALHHNMYTDAKRITTNFFEPKGNLIVW